MIPLTICDRHGSIMRRYTASIALFFIPPIPPISPLRAEHPLERVTRIRSPNSIGDHQIRYFMIRMFDASRQNLRFDQ